MPGLKEPVRRHTETYRGVVPDHDGLIGVKTATFPTAGLSSQERCQLRKRLRSEMEVVCGLLKKAKVLVGGKAVNGCAAPSKARPAPRRSQRQEPDQFAEKRKQRLEAEPEPPKNEAVGASGAISPSSPRQPEDGELAEEEKDLYVDICGHASPVAVDKVRCSSRLVRKDVELVEEDDNEFVDICGDASPVAIEKFSEACSSNSSSSGSSGSSCSDSSDSDSDSDDDDSVCSSPAPAVLPIGVAARPLELQSSASQVQKPQQAARPAGRITDLIARAHEKKRSRCRELDKKRAREELQEMERMAMPSDSIHPRDMMLLGITAVEYIVSSGDGTSLVRSMDGKLRLGSGRGSPVEKLGLFLKSDYFGGEEEEQDLKGNSDRISLV